MKTIVESLVDDIVRVLPLGVTMIPGFRDKAEMLVHKMIDAGFQIIPPGAMPGPSQKREKVEIDSGSVFCPHCGKHKPALGFQMGTCEVPNVGVIATLTIFCGECRAILNVTGGIAGPPTGKVQ